ncbi:MAG: ZPR1 zinc finger domain-containing protein [Nanobdellota archaeon]
MVEAQQEGNMQILKGEQCPICGEKELTLTEAERDIPFFGPVALFSMDCEHCKYHKADVEVLEERDPMRFTLEVESEADLNIRIIKSSFAKLKIGQVGSIEPGENANGYVTNVEGVLNRMKRQVEFIRDNAEDKDDSKKAKNMVKKLTKVLWGQDNIKITLDDPSGNSAIISEKAVTKKLPKSKK